MYLPFSLSLSHTHLDGVGDANGAPGDKVRERRIQCGRVADRRVGDGLQENDEGKKEGKKEERKEERKEGVIL